MALTANQDWLYKQMTGRNVDLGSEEQFAQAMQDENNRQWVYEQAGKMGIDLGTPEQFASAMQIPAVAEVREPKEFGNIQHPTSQIPTMGNDATRQDQTRLTDYETRVPEEVKAHNEMVARKMEGLRPQHEALWTQDKPMIDEIYRQAEQDANTEYMRQAEAYSRVPFDANGSDISRSIAIQRAANEQRDPAKLISAFNARLDERLKERFPELKDTEPSTDKELAFQLGKTPEDYSLYKDYVMQQLQQYFTDVNMPKSQLEYFARKVIQGNIIGQLYEIGTKPLSMRHFEAQGLGQYAQQNETTGLDFAAEVANVALDLPLMAATGGVGGAAERGLTRLTTRQLARQLKRRGMINAEQMAARIMAQNAWYRAGMGAVREGTMFSTLNTINAIGSDLFQEGKLTSRVPIAGAEGFITGAAMGGIRVPNNKFTSYLQDQYGRRTGTLVGAANTLAARTNIMVGGQALGAVMNGEDMDKFDWGNAYLHAGLMNMGFDFLGAGKLYIHNRASSPDFRTAVNRTISQLQSDPQAYIFSKEDIEKLNRAGVEGKDVREIVDNILRTEGEQNPLRSDVDKYTFNNDPQVREIQSRLENIFTNPDIDTEVKGKLYHIFTGQPLMAYALNTDSQVQQEDGKYVVHTYDNAGMIYRTRTFDNLDEAEKYRQRQVAETRPRLLNWCENVAATSFRVQAHKQMTDEVVRQLAQEFNMSEYDIRQQLKTALDNTMQGKPAEQTKAIADRYTELMEDIENTVVSGKVVIGKQPAVDENGNLIDGEKTAILNQEDIVKAYNELLKGERKKGFRTLFAKTFSKDRGLSEEKVRKVLDSKYESLNESDRKIYDDYVQELQKRIRPTVDRAEWTDTQEYQDPQALNGIIPTDGGEGTPAEPIVPEQVSPAAIEYERAVNEVTQAVGERTHGNGYIYPVAMPGNAEKTGYIVGEVVPVIDESNPEQLRIENDDVVTVKWSDGTVTQERARDLDLTGAPMMAQQAIDIEVENQMYAYTQQRIQNGEQPVLMRDSEGILEGFFPTEGGLLEDQNGVQYTPEQLAEQGWQETKPVLFVNDTQQIAALDNGDGTYTQVDALGIPIAEPMSAEAFREQGFAMVPLEEEHPKSQAPVEAPVVEQAPVEQAPEVQQPEVQEPAAPLVPNIETMSAADYAGAAVEYMGSREYVDEYLDGEIKKVQQQLGAANSKKVGNVTDMADFKAKKDAIEAEKKALQARLDKLMEAREKAKSYLTIAEREARAKAEAERRAAEEAARIAREQAAAAEAARLEQERIDREMKKGVPDFSEDNDRDARARGFHVVNGQVIRRQTPLTPIAVGKPVMVQFAKGKNGEAEAVNVLININELQPSHINGQRNPAFFVSEMQPKDRRDQVSKVTAQEAAQNIHPGEIIGGTTAYVGSPVVLSTGEVVQGNWRGNVLIEMYRNYPESVAKYKQALIDNAASLNLTEQDIERIKNEDVISVRMLKDLPIEQAIQLGQKKATDLETGGVQLIDPQVTATQLGDKIERFANTLLKSDDEEASLADLTLRNGKPALDFLQSLNIISPAQMQSAFDSRGNMTAETKAALQGVLKQVLFKDAKNDNLPIMFDDIPLTAQKAILQTIVRDIKTTNPEAKLTPHIQDAVGALYRALHQSTEVKNSRNEQETRVAMRSWAIQMQFPSDFDAENFVPSEIFSNFALELATLFKYGKQTEVAKKLNAYYDAVQGTTGGLFGDTPAIPYKEAIKQIFGIDYKSVDEVLREKHRKELTDYLNTIADEGHPFELYGNDNVIEILKGLGANDVILARAQELIDSGESILGIKGNGGLLLLNSDSLADKEAARSKYVHERQHLLTTPEQKERVLKAASVDELKLIVKIFTNGSDFYDRAGEDEIADEFISYSMEEAYAVESDEELESILRAAGANDELINIIKSINNEQRENDERLGQSERLGNARRHTDVDTDSEGHREQGGRDQGTESGVLEPKGARLDTRGELGGRTGGENQGGTEGAGLSEVGAEGVSGEEAGGAATTAGDGGVNQAGAGVGQERGLGEVTQSPTENRETTETKAAEIEKVIADFKKQYPDPNVAIFFRNGKTYDIYGEDAVKAAEILGVESTEKDGMPFVSFPTEDVGTNLRKFIAKGVKVGIASHPAHKPSKGDYQQGDKFIYDGSEATIRTFNMQGEAVVNVGGRYEINLTREQLDDILDHQPEQSGENTRFSVKNNAKKLRNSEKSSNFARELSRVTYPLGKSSISIDDEWSKIAIESQRESMPATAPWSENIGDAMVHTNLPAIKGKYAELHAKAKAGDVAAASDLVKAVVKRERVKELAERYPNAIVAFPHAEEASGWNKIPALYADEFAAVGLDIVDMVQANRPHHTGSDKVGRFVRRARYDGEVEAGREYILVDDHITMGGTLRDLKDYIESKGGKVVAVSALSASAGGTKLTPTDEQIKAIEEAGITNEQLKNLGIADNVYGITKSEAREILVLANGGGKSGSSQGRSGRNGLGKSTSQVAGDNDPRFSVGGTQVVPIDGKSLVGLHNISAEKLRKALKMGGLANPSAAVIDIAKQDHHDYGEVSLVLPSSLVERADGTYPGDAWTPMYPPVVYRAGKDTEKRIKALTKGMPDNLASAIALRIRDYMDGNSRNSGMEYLYLKEQGRELPIEHTPRRYPYISIKQIADRLGIAEPEYWSSDVYQAYEQLPEDQLFDFNLWLEQNGNQEEIDKRKAMVERWRSEGKDAFANTWVGRQSQRMSFAAFDSAGYRILRDERDAGEENTGMTLDKASYIVDTEGLRPEFETWLQQKIDGLGYEEVLFGGYTPSGNRRWLPNTVENASKLMNQKSQTNYLERESVNETKAMLMEKFRTLAQIRKHRDILEPDREKIKAAYEAVSSDWNQLGMDFRDYTQTDKRAYQLDDNPFIAIDTALARIQEAMFKADPIAFLNREYRYSLPADSEFGTRIKEIKERIKSLPSRYFETKFRRPVYLDEFRNAVVPVGLPQDLRDGLTGAGMTLFEYDPAEQGSRRAATLKATADEGIRFAISGRGASTGSSKRSNRDIEALRQFESVRPEIAEEMESIKNNALNDGTFMKAPNGKPTNLNERQWLQVRTRAFKRWFGDWENDPENASKVVDENGEPMVVEHSTPNEFTTFDIDKLGENSGDRGIFGAGFYFGDRGNTDIYGKNHMQVYLNMRKPFVMEDYMPDDISAFIVEHFNTPALRKIVLNENGKSITVGEYIDIVNAVNAEMEEGKHDAEIERISSFYRPDSARRKVRDDAIADKSFLIPGSLNYLISTMIGSQEFTNALRENGNDGGIVGKGNGYNEYVVFSPNQIKSATNNNGDFSEENDDIRFAISNQNNDIFYSNAERAVEGIKQEKATPEQWRAMIEKAGGLKAGEDKWIGLSDWLAQQRPTVELQPNETRSQFVERAAAENKRFTLSKQELLDYIREHKIQIEETEYGGNGDRIEDTPAFKEFQDEYAQIFNEKYRGGGIDGWSNAEREAMEEMTERHGGDDFGMAFYGDGDKLRVGDEAAATFFITQDGSNPPINETRLTYTTQGLENKREIALTVPTIESWNESDEIHFGDAGPGKAIAWVRFGDAKSVSEPEELRQMDNEYKEFHRAMISKYGLTYIDSDMSDAERQQERDLIARFNQVSKDHPKVESKVLVIDEIQSKRHQSGREQGYQEHIDRPGLHVEEYIPSSLNPNIAFARVTDENGILYGQVQRLSDGKYRPHGSNLQPIGWTDYNTEEEAFNIVKKEAETLNEGGVPDAPFEKNWHELAMKRILRFAAENGYDKVAWTTGDQQAERYNLGKRLEQIDVFYDDETGLYDVHVTEKGEDPEYDSYTLEEGLDDEGLRRTIGKDLYNRVMEQGKQEGWVVPVELAGDDLIIGVDGMRGFYDDILPRFMQKYGKKWGVQVGEVTMPDLEEGYQTMHAIDINDAMRESVMEGQPMFSISGRGVNGTMKPQEGETRSQYIARVAETVKNMTPRNTTIDDAIRFSITVNHNSPYLLKKADGSFVDPETGERLGFDHRFMGKGEGGQAHGWGSYFSARDIRQYADQPLMNGGITQYFDVDKIDAIDPHGRSAAVRAIETYRRTGIPIDQHLEYQILDYQKAADKHRAEGRDEVAEQVEVYVKEFKAALAGYTGVQRHHYSVEIPDNDGTNYFEEDQPLTQEQIDRLRKAAKETGIPKFLETISGFLRFAETNPEEYPFRKFYSDITDFQYGYPRETISNFLKDAGFVGIHYDGRRDGECYVIFDENDAKIVDYIRFAVSGRGREDRDGNPIGDGDWHMNYKVQEFTEYPQISSRVDKSTTTESVYVTYTNADNGRSVKVRFSGHRSNAERFGDVLTGGAPRGEILYRLGLATKEWQPFGYVPIGTISNKQIAEGNYEVADKTRAELERLPKGTDISEYKGKLVPGEPNRIYTGTFVGESQSSGIYVYKDANGNIIPNGRNTDYIRFSINSGKQKIWIQWHEDNPHPKYEEGEGLEHYRERLERWEASFNEMRSKTKDMPESEPEQPKSEPQFETAEQKAEREEIYPSYMSPKEIVEKAIALNSQRMTPDAVILRHNVINNMRKLREQLRRLREAENSEVGTITSEIEQGVRSRSVALRAEYEKSAKMITDMAKALFRGKVFQGMTDQDFSKMLTNIRDASTKFDLQKNIEIMEDIVQRVQGRYLRLSQEAVSQAASITLQRRNQSGVDIGKRVDPLHFVMISQFNALRNTNLTKIGTTLADLNSQIKEEISDTELEILSAKIAGAERAKTYQEELNRLQTDLDQIDSDIAQLDKYVSRNELKGNKRKEFMEQRRSLMSERAELIDELILLNDNTVEQLSSITRDGHSKFLERIQQKQEHKIEILRMMARDLHGIRSDEGAKEGDKGGLKDNYLSPLRTFTHELRKFGTHSAGGEGYLYSYFAPLAHDARTNYLLHIRERMEMLDNKARELFGEKATWNSVMKSVSNQLTEVEYKWRNVGADNMTVNSAGVQKSVKKPKVKYLTNGQIMYIYMVNKMTDGKAKLEQMGIDDATVAELKAKLPKELVQLADWLQEEYFPMTRKRYNETNIYLFDTPMAEIANYVPLKISGNAIDPKVDVGTGDMHMLPSNIVGNAISRTYNKKPIDIENTDAMDLVVQNMLTMEHWSAYAELITDLNTLLNSASFKHRIEQMNPNNYDNFFKTAQLAVDQYKPEVGPADKFVTGLTRFVATSKISLRWWTALKQSLSAISPLSEADPEFHKQYANAILHSKDSFQWAMENLPIFRERWESKQGGNEKLNIAEINSKSQSMQDMLEWAQENLVKYGISANAFVDAIVCANMAKAQYEAKKKYYTERGYSPEAVERLAKWKADEIYNETQQSSEGAYISAMQRDRTFIASSISLFNNSSMAYNRKNAEAIREAYKIAVRDKQEFVEFRKEQLMKDGVAEDQAAKFAEQDYKRARTHAIADMAINGYFIQFVWNVGGKAFKTLLAVLPFLFFGDDDEKKRAKEELLADLKKDAIVSGIQPIRGLPFGASFEASLNVVYDRLSDEENRRYMSTNEIAGRASSNIHPAIQDVSKLLSTLTKDEVDKLNFASYLVNLATSTGTSVDAQTVANELWALEDVIERSFQGKLTWSDIRNDVSILLNVPPSQIEYMILQPRKNETRDEFVQRYTEYVKLKKYGWFTPVVKTDDVELSNSQEDRVYNAYYNY